ncbi:MAG: electron transport complex subunit E [Deltaproteobacteria bacterium]|jgi:electron transport complex protein RnfE|nr:electron transport complex subunit E [Deltaproteobacteria bacterium]
MAKTIAQEFTKGLWSEIPPFRLVLGLCPVLAVTKTVENGIGMGLATTFVLVCSNILVSSLRKAIPNKVRIACFIIIIATFVTVVELVMQAYTYPLFLKLGIFIPLIVVNCIVLGRSEAFAFKNGVVASFADGLGMGIGFTLSLAALGAVRELFGSGTLTIWETPIQIFGPSFQPFTFMIEAPGAFVCLGLMLCVMNMTEK